MNKENAPIQDLLKKPLMVKTDNKPDGTKIIPDKIPGAGADAAREELEQRRNILQNMKDFDFQIKKNQEEITNIYTKVESLSKDLDDLVSLYEIVSEQMNPFVGLSKVTKKRLDALENIIKEVDGVKTRIGDLESNLEKNGATIKGTTAPIKPKPTTEMNAKPETPFTPKEPLVIPPSRPTALHATVIETLNESELDDLLNKSLESLLMEQNIDTMINEFFINLK
jgi:predicted RNase H-like nuclease (RuvC/YqgF family)